MNKKFLISYLICFLFLFGCSERPPSEKQKAINAYKERQRKPRIANSQVEEIKNIDEENIYSTLAEEEIPLTFYRKGMEHASQGKFEEAKSQFNKALDIYAFDEISIEHLAILNDMDEGVIGKEYTICLFKGGNYSFNNELSQAIAEFQKAIQINPNYARAHNGLGIIYLSMGQSQQAIAEFQKAIDIKSDEVSWHSALGIAYSLLEEYSQAIVEFRKAIQVNPNYAKAYSGLGAVYLSMGQPQQAIAEFQKSIQINPNESNGYGGLGVVYQSLGEHQKAASYNQKAIEINPGDGTAYVGLGLNYLYLEQPKQAIPCFQRGIQLNPYFIDSHYGLGFAYFSLGQYKEAQEAFQKLKKLSQSRGNYEMVKRAEKYLNKIIEFIKD